MRHWLLKTEPGTYSYADLEKDGKTNWNGVRNFQARNSIAEMKPGDPVLVYHSGSDRQVMGVARVSGAPYPDPDPRKPGDWLQVDLVPLKRLARPVTLAEMKGVAALRSMALFKQGRLSVVLVTEPQFKAVLKLGAS